MKISFTTAMGIIVLLSGGSLCASGAISTNTVVFGTPSDFFVSGDFDGDGKADIAIWRPGAAGVAAFMILRSSDGAAQNFIIGQPGDDPTVLGDYDGDGKTDPAIYRSGATSGAASTYWIYLSSATNYNPVTVTWGKNGDFPSPGDYDGDGRYDFVTQRNGGSGTALYSIKFATGLTETNTFATPTDVNVPGDYDGDGKTDLSIFRGSGGNLQWVEKLRLGSTLTSLFGNSATDYGFSGDYNGDGKSDLATYSNGVFSVHYSTGTNPLTTPASVDLQVTSGAAGDYPVARFNIH